jgi:hypothetical protein
MMAGAEAAATAGDVIGILPVFAAGAALMAAGSTQSASNCLVDAVRLYKVPLKLHSFFNGTEMWRQKFICDDAADRSRPLRLHAVRAAAAKALHRSQRCCRQAGVRCCTVPHDVKVLRNNIEYIVTVVADKRCDEWRRLVTPAAGAHALLQCCVVLMARAKLMLLQCKSFRRQLLLRAPALVL